MLICKAAITVGTKIVVRIKVSLDVTSVLVNGEEAELLRVSEKKGYSTYKAVLVPEEAGNFEISVTASDRDGNASVSLSNSVTVVPRKGGKSFFAVR